MEVRPATTEVAERMIRAIHESPTRVVLVTTGGGSLAVSDLLTIPGGSHTLLDALVPYSSGALAAFLGYQPDQYCSATTARKMASQASDQAEQLVQRGTTAGVACTASLVSDRAKRGEHRIHVAVQSRKLTVVATLELNKGARDRTGEERLAANLILNQLAEVCEVETRLPLDLLDGEQVVYDEIVAPIAWQQLVSGESNILCVGAADDSTPPAIVFSGAFNPIHAAHRGIADHACQEFAGPLAFEITIANVDKPGLDYLDMRDRAAQFAERDALLFTRAATFAEKAELFPGALFLVGVDTIERIDDPLYYDDCLEFRNDAIATIATRGCRFLVYGRLAGELFTQLSDLQLGDDLSKLCQEVPGCDFRVDVSSTELRGNSRSD